MYEKIKIKIFIKINFDLYDINFFKNLYSINENILHKWFHVVQNFD